MTPTPIKRSKNLVQLSKDHHEGLLVVWKIRQGLRNVINNERIAHFVLYAFDTHLEPHFIEEEELLFDKLPDNDQLLLKATEQHAAIRKMVTEMRSASETGPAQLEAFANLLEEHIRFEERELFGHIEEALPPEVMETIGARLEAVHNDQQPLDWKDDFWVKR